MNLHSDTKAPPSPTLEKQKLSYWRKLGGGSLGISLGIHALILAAGVYFVVQVIPKEEKQPELVIPRTDGPGKPPTSVRPQTSTSPSDLPRIVNKGRSDITLPEPSPSDAMPNLNPISNGPMETNKGSGGFISGAYGPESPAIGGPETGKSPFGIPNAKADGITGVFYDLKQTKNGKPTGLNDIQAQEVIREFVTKGWKDHTFADFYQAPERLKQTRIFIPMMNAAKAPEAFHCEKDVQPQKWVVVYRGNVVAPKSGKFRFVGGGDDVLAVRFNGQPVFDYGYTLAYLGLSIQKARALAEKDFTKEARRSHFPMPYPLQVRNYPNIGRFSRPAELAGIATGAEFQVEANVTYPIEILISEIPGGYFSSLLFIEESGTASPTSENTSLLPLFRMSTDLPRESKELPPYEKNSPVWQSRPDAGTIE